MLDKFTLLLIENYENYQKRHFPDGVELNAFITYLIDHNIIDHTTITRYTILEEFAETIIDSKHKTDAVAIVADKFNISKRTVWSIIKGHQGRFDANTENG
ncbi:MAG: hypothetical protein AAGG75_04175 [Bacteroidota bacterium]